MNIKIQKTLLISTVLFATMFGFQNCSEVAFSAKNGKSKTVKDVVDEVGEDDPADPTDPTDDVVDNNDPNDDQDDYDDQTPGDDEEYDHHCGCNRPKKTVRSGRQIIAFEDLYPGNPTDYVDYDYNDFVVRYSVKEHNKGYHLKRIEMKFLPIAKLAGYDHKFLVNLQEEGALHAFEGTATAKLIISDINHNVLSSTDVDPSKDIVIFDSTVALFGADGSPLFRAKLEVEVNGRDTEARRRVNLGRYRAKLYVKNTGYTLEVVESNNAHVNPETGHPYGMIVPESYVIPADQQNIEEIYPDFALFRNYLKHRLSDPTYEGTDEELEWYENIIAP